MRVGFFSFDAFARRASQLLPGGGLEDAYYEFLRDFSFVVSILEEEGLSPWIINYPSQTGETSWDQVSAAPKLGDLYIEEGARSLHGPAEGPAEFLDLVCMTDPDDGALVVATLSELNEDGSTLKQTNVYPVSTEGANQVIEYAKAVAQRTGLHLDVTEGPGLFIDEARRVVLSPPMESLESSSISASRTLH